VVGGQLDDSSKGKEEALSTEEEKEGSCTGDQGEVKARERGKGKRDCPGKKGRNASVLGEECRGGKGTMGKKFTFKEEALTIKQTKTEGGRKGETKVRLQTIC